ncbi:MAG TPA: response regulator, partial [Rhodospirillales bacterium]|nr:response regulator [Rhodospirillales bacterium]
MNEDETLEAALISGQRSLLIVDDDHPFLHRLARAMESRGFDVSTATTVTAALAAVDRLPPAFAIVDLRLEDGYGLDIVPALRERRADMRIIVLTGYGNIATAITAIKSGAVDYL